MKDRIWEINLSMKDENRFYIDKWRGQNLLGKFFCEKEKISGIRIRGSRHFRTLKKYSLARWKKSAFIQNHNCKIMQRRTVRKRSKEYYYESFWISIRIQTYQRPAPGYRAAGQRLQVRKLVRDTSGCYRFRKDIYHGNRHSVTE